MGSYKGGHLIPSTEVVTATEIKTFEEKMRVAVHRHGSADIQNQFYCDVSYGGPTMMQDGTLLFTAVVYKCYIDEGWGISTRR